MSDYDHPGYGRPRSGAPRPQIDPRRVFAWAWAAIVALIVIYGVLTSVYTVEANEEAVVLRFGKFHKIAGPGFHGKLPFGIDQALKEEVKTVHSAEFGYRTAEAGRVSSYRRPTQETIAEATMLTADLNLALVNWEVRYKIRDLRDYLFEVVNPRETVRDVSQAVMRTEVGDRSIDDVLTLDRTAIENAVGDRMQVQLDDLRCGVQVVKVNLKSVAPPDEVRDAFNAVNKAIQERDRIINEAEGERNRTIPAARGDKERVIKEAEGYAVGRVNRATGDTQAFLAVLEQYDLAKDVTRRRLYLEAMELLLPKLGDITLVDGDGSGVLKLLDLDRREGAR